MFKPLFKVGIISKCNTVMGMYKIIAGNKDPNHAYYLSVLDI